jgi:hypothetical protein
MTCACYVPHRSIHSIHSYTLNGSSPPLDSLRRRNTPTPARLAVLDARRVERGWVVDVFRLHCIAGLE